MRDFLKPSEYQILKAAQPLVVSLSCTGCGACFKHYWDLPRQVRDQINGYTEPGDHFLGKDAMANVDRFEVYEAETGKDDLILIAISHIMQVQYIECVGQYICGLFVERPRVVDLAMVAKVEAMSRQNWSWWQIPQHDRPRIILGLCLLPFAFATWAGVLIVGLNAARPWVLSHFGSASVAFVVLYFVVLVFSTVLGLAYSIPPTLSSWGNFVSHRKSLNAALHSYAAN